MIDRRAFAQLTGSLALVAGTMPNLAFASSTGAGRRAEATALIHFAETTHPRGREAKADPRWRMLANRFLASATSPVAEYIVRAFALLAWFQDGHTTLWASQLKAGPFGLDMPLRIAVFYDGLHVIEAAPDLHDLLGTRISRVGSMPIDSLMRQFAEIWPASNIADLHHDGGLLFTTPGLLHGLGIVHGADTAPIAVDTVDGDGTSHRGMAQPARTMERIKLKRGLAARETWAAEAKSGNYIRYLPADRALYVSLDDVNQDVEPFMAFTREIFAAMENADLSRLIIDLRRNPGGNNFLTEALRKHVERSRFNRPGGLYVLISPTTFSAAQNLSNRLERETFAIFAGEPTGGSPNHYGDANPFPGSILHGGVSTIPWFDSYPMDHRPWIMPDMLIPRMFADWSTGKDKVLDAVLADERSTAPDDLTSDRTFYYERKTQSAVWKPFWVA